MSEYRHVLFAMDYSEQAITVGRRALDISRRYQARFTILHVVEEVNISAGYELMPLLPELPDESMMQEARATLARVAGELGAADAPQLAVSAVSTKEGILRTAQEQGVDLIVVGSHGRHGLAVLLGSTANAVLDAAPCDVLAVRIPED